MSNAQWAHWDGLGPRWRREPRALWSRNSRSVSRPRAIGLPRFHSSGAWRAADRFVAKACERSYALSAVSTESERLASFTGSKYRCELWGQPAIAFMPSAAKMPLKVLTKMSRPTLPPVSGGRGFVTSLTP